MLYRINTKINENPEKIVLNIFWWQFWKVGRILFFGEEGLKISIFCLPLEGSHLCTCSTAGQYTVEIFYWPGQHLHVLLGSIFCSRSAVLISIYLKHTTKWGGPSDETGKTEAPCHSRCGMIKIPPCSNALSAKHRPKFCSSSPVMVTSPYKWNILERDVKQ
jgi:hypothetical protein